jgi:hypothetical protein
MEFCIACRKLYWLDEGGKGVARKVASVNFDGSGATTLVTKNLMHLDMITCDTTNKVLFWTDAYAQKVSTTNQQPMY